MNTEAVVAPWPPHVQRMIAEYKEHSVRVAALENFINKNELYLKLDTAEQDDQAQQLYGMQIYQEALYSRLVRAGVTPESN